MDDPYLVNLHTNIMRQRYTQMARSIYGQSLYDSPFYNTRDRMFFNERGILDWHDTAMKGAHGIYKAGKLWIQTREDYSDVVLSLGGTKEVALFTLIDNINIRLDAMDRRLDNIEKKINEIECFPPVEGGSQYKEAAKEYARAAAKNNNID